MSFPAFTSSPQCPKDGHTQASVRWCPGTGQAPRVERCETEGEHIHRQCARCQYMWLEQPLDAEGV